MKGEDMRQVMLCFTLDGNVVTVIMLYKELIEKIKIAKREKSDFIEVENPETKEPIQLTVKSAEDIAKKAKLIYRKDDQNKLIYNYLEKSLEGYLTNMNNLYDGKKASKLLGRDEEIQRIWTCLSGRQKNNAILIGEDGVGKTAITKEIARQIAFKECPKGFENFTVFRLETKAILNITSERKRKEIFRKISWLFKLNEYSILIIDNLMHVNYDFYTLVFFNNIVVKGKVRILAGINVDDYVEYIEEGNVTRYLNEIVIAEPSISELYEILPRKVKSLEKKHGIKMSDELLKFAIDTAYYLSSSNSSNPESTIDTINYAMNKARIDGKEEVDKDSILAYYRIDFKLANNMKEEMKKSTAFHEAGHYLVRKMSGTLKGRENAFVSILPIGDSLGLNADYFKVGECLSSDKEYYIDNIAYCLGGRIAEYVYTNSYSSGASSDLDMATSLAEQLVLSFGLSEESSKNRSYSTNGYLKTFLLTDELRKEINGEINKIIDTAYKRAEKIIDENRDLLKKIVNKLLEEGVLTGRELEELCK